HSRFNPGFRWDVLFFRLLSSRTIWSRRTSIGRKRRFEMRMRWMTTGVLALGLAGLSSSTGDAQAAKPAPRGPEKMNIDQAPAAVKATLQQEGAKSPVDQVEKRSRGGKSEYAAE